MMNPITIVAISGSLKSTSVNTSTINALQLLAPKNVTLQVIRGLDLLPHFNPDTTAEIYQVTLFKKQIEQADAVIICTPEYAFGVPGVLKNALDWLVSSGELNNKPVAPISVSTLNSGGAHALASLRLTLSALGTITESAVCLSIGTVKSKIDEAGVITDTETLDDLKSLLTSLLKNCAIKIKATQ